MGKSAGEANGAASGKMFSADVVAALIMSFGQSSISKAQYELMSAMDGVKTASAFQHDFRSVLAKARELKARQDSGETFEAVQPGSKRGQSAITGGRATPPATLTKKQKAAATKPKATPKSRNKKQTIQETDAMNSSDGDQPVSKSSTPNFDFHFSNFSNGIKSEPNDDEDDD